ncbi:hypothetical protein DPMN_156745, partial [Dreissena polymorpha]
MAEYGFKENTEEADVTNASDDVDIYCEPCSTDCIKSFANGFCLQCDEYLCSTCIKDHKKFAVSRTHSVLDQANMPSQHQKTQKRLFECTEPCRKHQNEIIKFFCKLHANLVCSVCITLEHRTCEVEYIPEASTDFQNKAEYLELKKQMEDSTKYIETKLEEMRTELENINEVEEIKNFQMEINVLIERKEKELLDKMQDFKRANNYVADKIKGEIETAYSHLSVMNKSLNDSAAHDIQLYMAVKTMKSQLECINNSIEEARKGTPFTEFGFMKNTALVDFLQSTGAFGTIETPQQTLYVNNDCIVTAAISLGVTYTNLAWTLISHSAPRVIEFFGRDVVRIKVPTSLLIQSDGRTLESFGYDAEEKYADFTENGTQNDWYYFERFWLDLNENMDTFRITTVLKDKSGKEMRAVSLISLLIKFFVQRLLTFSRTVGANVTAKDIHLILTVPGNWNSNTKILLQLAVKKTCLKVGKVSIMLESEAAALYCLQLPKADSIGRIRYNKEESHLIPKTGQHFLICDFQEDKLAINLHSMESGMQMEHIITEHDRKLGVSKVVEDFETFMNALAGCEIIAVIKKSHLDEYT